MVDFEIPGVWNCDADGDRPGNTSVVELVGAGVVCRAYTHLLAGAWLASLDKDSVLDFWKRRRPLSPPAFNASL